MAENYITITEEKGTIFISEEVISNFIRTTVTEIEGVGSIQNASGAEFAELVGIKYFKGIKICSENNTITVDIIMTVKYGNNIIDVANNVQSSVASQLESLLGLNDVNVNIHVSGISFL